MNKISFIVLIALLGLASASVANKACFYIVNDTSIYSLISFSALPNQTIPISVSHANVTNNITENITADFDLNFHLCNRQVNSCVNSTNGTVPFNYATLTETADNYCQNLTDAAFDYSPVASFYDDSDSDAGVVLTFPPTVSLGENITFIVELTCNSSIPTDQIEWTARYNSSVVDNITSYVYTITGRGAPGCPNSLSKLIVFFDTYIYFFAAAFIIIGLLSLFGGIKFFNITIFILTAVLVASISAIIIFELTTAQTTTVTKWVIFVICICIGCGAGYAAVKIERIGFFALGALLGTLGSLFLYNSLLHFLGLSDTLLFCLVAFCGIIGGGLGVWLWKKLIILGTSCIGSYLVVRGISLFVPDEYSFPSEVSVADGSATFNYIAYVYLAVIVLLAIGGIVFQWKNSKKDEDLENEYHKESLVREDYY